MAHMSQEFLSVKLGELESALRRLYSRVEACETAGHGQVKEALVQAEKECEDASLAMERKLGQSRGKAARQIHKAYEQIRETAREIQSGPGPWREQDEGNGEGGEDGLLLAEYALDFAVQAAGRALCLSLKAIDAQMTRQEKEEDCYEGS